MKSSEYLTVAIALLAMACGAADSSSDAGPPDPTGDGGSDPVDGGEVPASCMLFSRSTNTTSPEGPGLYLYGSDGTAHGRLTNEGETDTVVAASPDGSRVAVGVFVDHGEGMVTEMRIMNADGGDAITAIQIDGRSHWLGVAWSPDGTRIAVASDAFMGDGYKVGIVDASGGGDIVGLPATYVSMGGQPNGFFGTYASWGGKGLAWLDHRLTYPCVPIPTGGDYDSMPHLCTIEVETGFVEQVYAPIKPCSFRIFSSSTTSSLLSAHIVEQCWSGLPSGSNMEPHERVMKGDGSNRVELPTFGYVFGPDGYTLATYDELGRLSTMSATGGVVTPFPAELGLPAKDDATIVEWGRLACPP